MGGCRRGRRCARRQAARARGAVRALPWAARGPGEARARGPPARDERIRLSFILLRRCALAALWALAAVKWRGAQGGAGTRGPPARPAVPRPRAVAGGRERFDFPLRFQKPFRLNPSGAESKPSRRRGESEAASENPKPPRRVGTGEAGGGFSRGGEGRRVCSRGGRAAVVAKRAPRGPRRADAERRAPRSGRWWTWCPTTTTTTTGPVRRLNV